MNMIIPVIMHQHNNMPAACPKCGKLENVIEVCAHCGYEYHKNDWYDSDWFLIPMVLLSIAILVWLLVTILEWFVVGPSLREVLKTQWEFLKNLKW